MTSSKISTVPCAVQSSRSASRKPGFGSTKFMLPQIGSTMTQPSVSPRSAKSRRSASSSLNGSVSVCFATSAGMPGELGTPSVSAPEPALTRRASECPW